MAVDCIVMEASSFSLKLLQQTYDLQRDELHLLRKERCQLVDIELSTASRSGEPVAPALDIIGVQSRNNTISICCGNSCLKLEKLLDRQRSRMMPLPGL